MATVKKTTVYINGMHCPSCDILVKDTFCEMKNVKEVRADHKNQTAEVLYTGELNQHTLNKKLQPYGYSIAEKPSELELQEPFIKKVTDVSAIAIILFIVYFFLQELQLLPQLNAAATGLTFITVFILGLVASTSTCMATSGALFMATIGKLKQEGISIKENIVPAVAFNAGRVLSYGVFGYIVGSIGKVFTTSAQLSSFLTLFVSVVMILIALDMLKLISFSWVGSTAFTKGIFQRLQSKLIKNPKQTAFFLGAITYLLPCGFTQSVQVYALGQADPVKSAVIMMIFALGTVPALLALGFASTFTKNTYYPLFQKAMGVVILMIGIGYILNFASLRGVALPALGSSANAATNVIKQNGVQVMRMSVNSAGYAPSSFTINQGEPAKWIIEGENVFGCQSILLAPKLGIEKVLQLGENVVEFTPQEKGLISFSCSMGMYNGSITVI